MPTQHFSTDDLGFAATLAAFGARVVDVTYVGAKRRSDIQLDLQSLDVHAARDMLQSLATRLGDLPADAEPSQIEMALDGSVLHHALSRFTDLKRKVVARKHGG